MLKPSERLYAQGLDDAAMGAAIKQLINDQGMSVLPDVWARTGLGVARIKTLYASAGKQPKRRKVEGMRRPSLSYVVQAATVTLGLYLFWYFKAQAEVGPETLRIRRGIFRRFDVTIPTNRVTNVRAVQVLWPGMSQVIIGTGSGEGSVTVPHLARRHARAFAREVDAAVQVRKAAE